MSAQVELPAELTKTSSLAASQPLPALWASHQQQRAFRIALLLGAVIVLNAVDLAYTLFAHGIGMLTEVNPLAESFLRLNLTQSLICYKILMLLCGTIMLWRSRLSRWTVPACWLLVLCYVGLSVVWYLWVKDVTYVYEMQAAISTRATP